MWDVVEGVRWRSRSASAVTGTRCLNVLSRVHTKSGGAARLHTKSTYRRVTGASMQSQRMQSQGACRLERVYTLTLHGGAPPRRFRCERGVTVRPSALRSFHP